MLKRVCVPVVLAVVLVLHLTSPAANAAPSFEGIGIVPVAGSPGVRSYVSGISADGSTVVGGSSNGIRAWPAYWNETDGLQAIPFAGGPQGYSIPTIGAHDASADGSIITGMIGDDGFVWTATGGLETVVDGRIGPGGALAISDDGSVLAGWNELGVRQSVWYSDSGVLINPDAPFDLQGTFEDVSASGEFATGWLNNPDISINPPAGRTEAVRWSLAGGTDFIPPIAGASVSAEGRALSDDGQIVVGYMSTGVFQTEAFLWDGATDISIGLGDINSLGTTVSRALAISGDGSVVVGKAGDGAFIWDEANGMRLLADVLTSVVGLDLAGWTLDEATAISSDGLTIAGNGINASGQLEGWVAVIPEPGTGLLVGFGLSMLSARRRAGRGAA